MENLLNKINDSSDSKNIVYRICFFFLKKKVEEDWKDIQVWNGHENRIQPISEWFPSKIPEPVILDDIYWKAVNQIFFTYYHFTLIREYCMRFYIHISLDIFNEWLKILISMSSVQELYKKDIEKLTEIYFQLHLDMNAQLPVKLNFTFFSEYLNYHSFMDNFFIVSTPIRPRNLSIEMEFEDNELVEIIRTASPSLMIHSISPREVDRLSTIGIESKYSIERKFFEEEKLDTSFKNFEMYSRHYQGGFTPYHFWIHTSSPLSPTSFAN
jgi:hypothetical protein